jgi:hypothetical protein
MRHTKRSNRDADYEVGYGRPPRKHQWKKGQPSANPKGRPRGSRRPNLAEVLLELVPIKIQGRTRKVPYLEAFAQVMKDKAIKGDPKLGQMLLLLAKQLGLLDVRDNIAGQVFTFRLNTDRPGWRGPPDSHTEDEWNSPSDSDTEEDK